MYIKFPWHVCECVMWWVSAGELQLKVSIIHFELSFLHGVCTMYEGVCFLPFYMQEAVCFVTECHLRWVGQRGAVSWSSHTVPQWTGGQPTGVHHISSRGRGWWVAAWGSVMMASTSHLLICAVTLLTCAGELYILSIRGHSSEPLAGSLIQIVDPSR